ncbi:MAG: hypothetical protein ACHQVK_04440 [Candidatus Paceibacterales bacterium]
MNGDGKPDLVAYAGKTGGKYTPWGMGSNPYWKVYLNTVFRPTFLLKDIRNAVRCLCNRLLSRQ